MENRLELNKKPKYELPDEVLIGQYNVRCVAKTTLPPFEPDICVNAWGRLGNIEPKKYTKNQIWIKTNNKELITFIKNYNFKNYKNRFVVPVLSINDFKKIILEEFYNKL